MTLPDEPQGPVVLDALAFVHLARGDAYGEHLDSTFGLRGRKVAPMLCSVTVGEIYRIARRTVPIEEYESIDLVKIDGLVGQMTIANITGALMRAYGRLMAMSDDSDSPIRDSARGWAAATAHLHKVPLITHSPEFKKFGSHIDCFVIPREDYLEKR